MLVQHLCRLWLAGLERIEVVAAVEAVAAVDVGVEVASATVQIGWTPTCHGFGTIQRASVQVD